MPVQIKGNTHNLEVVGSKPTPGIHGPIRDPMNELVPPFKGGFYAEGPLDVMETDLHNSPRRSEFTK